MRSTEKPVRHRFSVDKQIGTKGSDEVKLELCYTMIFLSVVPGGVFDCVNTAITLNSINFVVIAVQNLMHTNIDQLTFQPSTD